MGVIVCLPRSLKSTVDCSFGSASATSTLYQDVRLPGLLSGTTAIKLATPYVQLPDDLLSRAYIAHTSLLLTQFKKFFVTLGLLTKFTYNFQPLWTCTFRGTLVSSHHMQFGVFLAADLERRL